MTTNRLIQLLIVLAFISLMIILYPNSNSYNTGKKLQLKYDSLANILSNSITNDMAKTLQVIHPLSVYEAKHYAAIFNDLSNKHVVPWEIYAAIIWQESRFKANAHSNKNAKGLSQVMPKTFEMVCKNLNIRYKKNQTEWNDIINIVVGMTYLSEGISEIDMEHGIKRYYAGPSWKNKKKVTKSINKYYNEVMRRYNLIRYVYIGVKEDNKENLEVD